MKAERARWTMLSQPRGSRRRPAHLGVHAVALTLVLFAASGRWSRREPSRAPSSGSASRATSGASRHRRAVTTQLGYLIQRAPQGRPSPSVASRSWASRSAACSSPRRCRTPPRLAERSEARAARSRHRGAARYRCALRVAQPGRPRQAARERRRRDGHRGLRAPRRAVAAHALQRPRPSQPRARQLAAVDEPARARRLPRGDDRPSRSRASPARIEWRSPSRWPTSTWLGIGSALAAELLADAARDHRGDGARRPRTRQQSGSSPCPRRLESPSRARALDAPRSPEARPEAPGRSKPRPPRVGQSTSTSWRC
jgi:hypothetical protein